MCNFDLLNSFFSAARERCYKQIAAAVAKYREFKKNINEGLNFYVTLQVWLHFHFHIVPFAFNIGMLMSPLEWATDFGMIPVYRKQ